MVDRLRDLLPFNKFNKIEDRYFPCGAWEYFRWSRKRCTGVDFGSELELHKTDIAAFTLNQYNVSLATTLMAKRPRDKSLRSLQSASTWNWMWCKLNVRSAVNAMAKKDCFSFFFCSVLDVFRQRHSRISCWVGDQNQQAYHHAASNARINANRPSSPANWKGGVEVGVYCNTQENCHWKSSVEGSKFLAWWTAENNWWPDWWVLDV